MYFRHNSRMESHLINCLHMNAEPTILTLSDTAFWDTDMHTLDMDQHKDFIIARVFMHGSLEDYKLVVRRYTPEEIKQALQQYRGLDKLTREFAETLGFL